MGVARGMETFILIKTFPNEKKECIGGEREGEGWWENGK